jgi:prepilin-type processing-associated H-X9-DG protein
MTIEAYFWALLAILAGGMVFMAFSGFALGVRRAKSGGGLIAGLAILAIFVLLVGGAKWQESKVGPILVYECAWLASAFNFALAGGYLAGKHRHAAELGRRAPAVLCGAIALASLFLVGARLHQLVDVLQQLGVGSARPKIAGPDTSLNCKDSLKRIYAGFQHYAEVDDALPPAAKWIDEEDLRGAVQADEWFHCPAASNRKDDKYGYAYNDAIAGRKLNGKKLSEMPDAAKTPLVFDSSNLAKNAHDPLTSLPKPGRHGGRNNILYCDGHIEAVAPK